MSDLATMMRDQLQTNWKSVLDTAVQNGDVESARKASDQLALLATAAAPKPTGPAFNEADIRKVMETKAPWFGVDPRKSAKAVDYAKSMHMNRFQSADAFAEALIKAVDADEKPAPTAAESSENPENPESSENPENPEEPATPRQRKTDAQPELRQGTIRRGSATGPWAKLADAPKDVADTIRKQTDKFARNATKEQREKFQQDALASAYRAHQRKK